MYVCGVCVLVYMLEGMQACMMRSDAGDTII
jgi:hypothetical protein